MNEGVPKLFFPPLYVQAYKSCYNIVDIDNEATTESDQPAFSKMPDTYNRDY